MIHLICLFLAWLLVVRLFVLLAYYSLYLVLVSS
jgi:hypothetical protein|nr:MAG TPA: hypothetical protein [Podoviridae sp. ctK5Q1]